MPAIGRTRWAIPEGYIPSGSVSQDRALLSHETACILNAGERDAKTNLRLAELQLDDRSGVDVLREHGGGLGHAVVAHRHRVRSRARDAADHRRTASARIREPRWRGRAARRPRPHFYRCRTSRVHSMLLLRG